MPWRFQSKAEPEPEADHLIASETFSSSTNHGDLSSEDGLPDDSDTSCSPGEAPAAGLWSQNRQLFPFATQPPTPHHSGGSSYLSHRNNSLLNLTMTPAYGYEELLQYDRGFQAPFGSERTGVAVVHPESPRSVRKMVVRETAAPQPVVANTKAVRDRDKGSRHVDITHTADGRVKAASLDMPRL